MKRNPWSVVRRPLSAICLLSSVLSPPFASAQAPQIINYQGRLLNGTNLVNGGVGLSLRLFNVPGGGAILYEDSNIVTVVDGLYSTFIGDHPTNNAFLTALTNAAVWVEVAVNGLALSPRERLASVGHSLSTRGVLVRTNGSVVLNLEAGSNVMSAASQHATIGGGLLNQVLGSSWYSFIGGGFFNQIHDSAPVGVIVGGNRNQILPLADNSFIGGGYNNSVQLGAYYGVLGGGELNAVRAHHSLIGGGFSNAVGSNSHHSVLVGGQFNTVSNDSEHSFIGAGRQNSIGQFSENGVIAGGYGQTIGRASAYSTIGGGGLNRIGSGAVGSVIAGGGAFGGGGIINIDGNEILSSASFIGGGWLNAIETNAGLAAIVGGQQNLIRTNALAAVIGGGLANTVGANARYAVIPGGRQNAVGDTATNALAAGRRARADHRGAFVWADDTDAEFASTANNQFLIRASGGVGIGTPDPGAPLHVQRGASGGAINTSSTLALEHSTNNFFHMLSATNAAQGVLFGTPGNEIEASIRFNNNRGREITFRAGSNQVRMAIMADGNVGVGTTAPGEKLEVNGNVLVNDFLMIRRTTASPVGGTTLSPQSGFVQLEPASNVVLNTTTSLASGQREGQMLILQGDSSYTVSIVDSSNVALGAATRVIGFRDVLTLIWSGYEWIETSFANN